MALFLNSTINGEVSFVATSCALKQSSSLVFFNHLTFLPVSSSRDSRVSVIWRLAVSGMYWTLFKWQQTKLADPLLIAVLESCRQSSNSQDRPPSIPNLWTTCTGWLVPLNDRLIKYIPFDKSTHTPGRCLFACMYSGLMWMYLLWFWRDFFEEKTFAHTSHWKWQSLVWLKLSDWPSTLEGSILFKFVFEWEFKWFMKVSVRLKISWQVKQWTGNGKFDQMCFPFLSCS